MLSTTALAPVLVLGALTASLMQYEFEMPPHISLVFVVPALVVGVAVTYGISYVLGIPVWYVIVALCMAVVGAALLSEL